jgi:hypothetical protein
LKKGLKPTKRQKIAIQAAGLNYDNWLVYKNIEGKLHLVHRETGTKKVILS